MWHDNPTIPYKMVRLRVIWLVDPFYLWLMAPCSTKSFWFAWIEKTWKTPIANYNDKDKEPVSFSCTPHVLSPTCMFWHAWTWVQYHHHSPPLLEHRHLREESHPNAAHSRCPSASEPTLRPSCPWPACNSCQESVPCKYPDTRYVACSVALHCQPDWLRGNAPRIQLSWIEPWHGRDCFGGNRCHQVILIHSWPPCPWIPPPWKSKEERPRGFNMVVSLEMIILFIFFEKLFHNHN